VTDWYAIYEDGSTHSTYNDLDRSRMESFVVSTSFGTHVVGVHKSDPDQFFYRRRTRITQGNSPETIFLFGWLPDRIYVVDQAGLQEADFDRVGGPPEPIPGEPWA
jgi:hypothetical protein